MFIISPFSLVKIIARSFFSFVIILYLIVYSSQAFFKIKSIEKLERILYPILIAKPVEMLLIIPILTFDKSSNSSPRCSNEPMSTSMMRFLIFLLMCIIFLILAATSVILTLYGISTASKSLYPSRVFVISATDEAVEYPCAIIMPNVSVLYILWLKIWMLNIIVTNSNFPICKSNSWEIIFSISSEIIVSFGKFSVIIEWRLSIISWFSSSKLLMNEVIWSRFAIIFDNAYANEEGKYIRYNSSISLKMEDIVFSIDFIFLLI